MSRARIFAGLGLLTFTAIAAALSGSDEAPAPAPPPRPPTPPHGPPPLPPAGSSTAAREAATLAAVRAGRASFEWLPIDASEGETPYPSPVPPAIEARAAALLTSTPIGGEVHEPNPAGRFPFVVYRKEHHAAGKVGITAYAPTGHTARFWVLGDALRVDGVRVNAGARLQQQIADLLGARLLTPKLSDLRFAQAAIRVEPQPMAIAASLAAEREHSANVDRAIVGAVGSLDAARGRIVAPAGKDWTIGAALATHPGRGQNYGWHAPGEPGASWKGIKLHAPASKLASVGVIQPAATAHDLGQDDYSQTVVLVRQAAELDGAPTTIDRILTDPALAPLASAEGALPLVRQPGVPDASGVA